jgi:hypothetical protein
MPEFHIDLGSPDAADLDAFTRGYIEAAFFTESGSSDDGDMKDATFADLAPETFVKMEADCAKFLEGGRLLIDKAQASAAGAPDDSQAGRDFWYTRNGHGCGFWDGDWPEPFGDDLTLGAKAFGTCDLYRGDDGLIYS